MAYVACVGGYTTTERPAEQPTEQSTERCRASAYRRSSAQPALETLVEERPSDAADATETKASNNLADRAVFAAARPARPPRGSP